MASESWMVIDDSNSNITYVGSWKTQNDTAFFMSGYHFTTVGNTSSLSYSFYGSEVAVNGGFMGQNTVANNAVYPKCSLDGLPMSVVPQIPQNGGPFFFWANNLSTQHGHKLTIDTQTTSDQPFRIDYIRYNPALNLSNTTDAYIQLPNATTSNFTFDEDWDFQATGFPVTNTNASFPMALTWTTGSVVTYEFYGTSIAWFGCCFAFSAVNTINAANATYNIDGSHSTYFQIDETSVAGPPNCINQRILFQETSLPLTSHTMTVTYHGDTAKMPLSLCGIASTTTSSNFEISGDFLPSSSPSPMSTPRMSRRTGAIIGGVIGGLALTFLLVYMVVFILRRKRVRHHAAFTPFDVGSQRSIVLFSANSQRNISDSARLEQISYSSEKSLHAPRLSGPLPDSGESHDTTHALINSSQQSRVDDVRRARQQELERRLRVMQQDMMDLTSYLNNEQQGSGDRNPLISRSGEPRRGDASDEEMNVDELREQLRSMRQQVVYLQEQQHSAWAQGLSDEPPPGYTQAGVENRE